MDTRQLEYILRISEERSITRAAERLFVTQSALNQQLQRIEAELGMPLFTRTRSDWRLTPAGEVYANAARQILRIEQDATSRIQDMHESCRRRITLGLIPERGVDMFTDIYPRFHQQFPDVRIEPVECNVRTIQQLISHDELDLGLCTLIDSQRDENSYLHMADEEIYLGVPSSHPLASLGSPTAEDAPEISLARFREDPFIMISRRSTMFHLVELLFREAEFEPEVLFSTVSNISEYRMVRAGVGCALLPRTYAVPDPGIIYFRPEGQRIWQVTMCYRKGSYLTRAETTFLELCREYWRRILPPMTSAHRNADVPT